MDWDLDLKLCNNDSLVLDRISDLDKNNAISLWSIIYLFYYVIGNLFYNSELYSRQKFICDEFDFTTNKEIYELTGVYRITFNHIDSMKNSLSSMDSVSDYLKVYCKDLSVYQSLSSSYFHLDEINDVVLYGNTDMLYHYLKLVNISIDTGRYSRIKLVLLDDGERLLKGRRDERLELDSLLSFLSSNVLCSDYSLLFRSDLKIKPYIYYFRSSNSLLNLLKNNDIILKNLEVYDIHTLLSFMDSTLFELCNYVEHIYILVNETSHLYVSDKYLESLREFVDSLKNKNITNINFKFVDSMTDLDKLYSLETYSSYISDYLV